MNEQEERLEELKNIVSKLTDETIGFIVANARSAYYGEQAIKRQYGLDDTPKAERTA